MPLNPRDSGKLISSLAKHVKINELGVQKLGDELLKSINSGELSIESFSQNDVHPKYTNWWAIDWLFVVDALNYCFWSKEHESGWTVEGKTGYFALCVAINRAMRENVDILNAKYYSVISRDDLKEILRSDNEVDVPLLDDRVKCLHEAGSVLLEKFDGSFINCVKKAENSAVKLLDIIISNFKCFRDEASYKGHEVSLYKRAQILIGDIWACHRGEGLGKFKDIEEITMFADYRVPQSLLYYNVIEYSNELNDLLKKNNYLENGNEMEVEIRGVSIHAVELLREYITKKLGKDDSKKVNSIIIDHFLWDFRRKHAKEILKIGLPFHKTFCIYY
ncbi:queuosine 5'-phosphate N-glycosylase/hydrolase [Onthophagus taurus]|uniref:queuosine 5'-phosphate N-glycosylase/hydrolase n=1 Tax=Onthophagus taurus TaxID=166361 RepID=UPI0039BDD66D